MFLNQLRNIVETMLNNKHLTFSSFSEILASDLAACPTDKPLIFLSKGIDNTINYYVRNTERDITFRQLLLM